MNRGASLQREIPLNDPVHGDTQLALDFNLTTYLIS